jgi:hypothetical protein
VACTCYEVLSINFKQKARDGDAPFSETTQAQNRTSKVRVIAFAVASKLSFDAATV